jgi:hypothetical protein
VGGALDEFPGGLSRVTTERFRERSVLNQIKKNMTK